MSFFDRMRRSPLLADLSFTHLTTLCRLFGTLKDEIALVQPNSVDLSLAPLFLPPVMVQFLCVALDLEPPTLREAWIALKDIVWASPRPVLTRTDKEIFRVHGFKLGFSWISLFPPSHTCSNLDCTGPKQPLKADKPRQAVLYTLADGALPVWTVHLTCAACATSYHHNFAVNSGMRTYYAGPVSPYIQIGEHQFAEYKVISSWISMMLSSWTSATNCARIYEMSLAEDHNRFDDWQFGPQLTPDLVWDAFTTLTLLQYHHRNDDHLVVPHTGLQKDRFTKAMAERNTEVVTLGQEEIAHACDRCLRVFTDASGTRDVQVVVGDGLSMGHPCCAEPHCSMPLANNHHRFCPSHKHLHQQCSIVGCTAPVREGAKSCADPVHTEMERLHTQRGQAAFTLVSRLQKHRITHPDETEVDFGQAAGTGSGVDGSGDEHVEESVPAADNEEWFRINDDAGLTIEHRPHGGSVGMDDTVEQPCEATKDPAGNRKLKAKFSRSRSHNEFILSRPCGVIVNRATFFTAEAVSNALLCVQKTFAVPGAHRPDHFVYDTNCDALQQVHSRPAEWEWFLECEDPPRRAIGMSVDVFHFLHKHSITHTFCQTHCNPSKFPEMMDGNKWYFNTSIAEQNNVWLGGYHSMCREMTATKYNFFLNEMVRLRNMTVVAKLEAAGLNPRTRL